MILPSLPYLLLLGASVVATASDVDAGSGACSVCKDGSTPQRKIFGTDYGSGPYYITIELEDSTTKSYFQCDELDVDARSIFGISQCNQMYETNVDYFCSCEDATPPNGFGNCELCPNHDIVVSNEYVGYDLQESCDYGESEAPNYSNDECWSLINEYQSVCCKNIQTVPFVAPAIEYTNMNELSVEQNGNCGDFSVDVQYTTDEICMTRDGAECNIGWTEPGEWVEYAFISYDDVDVVDIRVRVSAQGFGRRILLSLADHPSNLQQEFVVNNLGWQSFVDILWESVTIPNTGTQEAVRVTFLDGKVNLCSVAVLPAGYYEVPFTVPALDFTDYHENTPNHIGRCPIDDKEKANHPVDSKSAGDPICYSRGADCTIGWTEPGEWVEYGFVSHTSYVDIIVRVASNNPSMMFTLGVGENVGGEFTVSEFTSPGLGWYTFRDVIWRGVSVNPWIADAVKVTFDTGKVNLCSISVVPSGTGGGGPEFMVPYTVNALTDYAGYNENSPGESGNCGDGIVDAQRTSDETCVARGAVCNVGWTEPGEYLEYEFYARLDTVDVTVRVASINPKTAISVSLYDAVSGSILNMRGFNTPGLGWQEFRDLVWENVSVKFVDHVKVRIFFDTGMVNLCTVSLTPS